MRTATAFNERDDRHDTASRSNQVGSGDLTPLVVSPFHQHVRPDLVDQIDRVASSKRTTASTLVSPARTCARSFWVTIGRLSP